MAVRVRPAVGFLLLSFFLAAGSAPAPQAQTRAGSLSRSGQAKAAGKWVVPRTADGHPDFHGVWANNTVTPLQRPKQWEGKTRLTDAEVAELQKFAAQITENDGDAQFGDGLINAVLSRIAKPTSYDPGTGNYNQFWLVERDWHDRRTSLIIDPPNGQLPPRTPEAEKRRAEEIEYRKTHAFEDPEVFPLGERCVNFTIPRLQAGYNSYFQIVQAPGHVMIMAEMAHDARIIPTDGRPHLPPTIRPWNGDSRGRWEGDTLVVDTTNFSPKSDFMGSHENLHLIERFTRTAHDVLEYQLAVNDPTTWTAPWTAMIPLKLKDELIYEYACHEGNDAIPNMLRGHRYEERQAATKSQPK
jgi:hypothetical protein